MPINTTGKAVKNLRLPTVDYINSPVTVINAQKSDVNSRFVAATLFDDRGEIDLGMYTGANGKITLNATTPGGDVWFSLGEIVDGKIYCELTPKMLSEEGRVVCDISLNGKDSGGNEAWLTSQSVYINVSASQYDDDAVEDTEEYNLLLKLIDSLKGIEAGVYPLISVSAETLQYGDDATVVKSGSLQEPHFTFGIPTGITPNITVSVNAIGENDFASVVQTGTAVNPHLTFNIPRGKTGLTGVPGLQGMPGIQGVRGDQGERGATGATPVITAGALPILPGLLPQVEVSGTPENPYFLFKIPKGEAGEKGDKGDRGDAGVTPNIAVTAVGTTASEPSVVKSGTNENPFLIFYIPRGEKGVPGAPGTVDTSNFYTKAEIDAMIGNISAILENNANGVS